MLEVSVRCAKCGPRGAFYITPEQHKDGAIARAKQLAAGHEHPCSILIPEEES